ncbi:MAG: hypothetical protein AAB580_02225 [Patescibacteria group bacterium]
MFTRKFFLILGLCLAVFFLAHNLYFFPNRSGYIFALHVKYTQIISEQWRYPTIDETAKFYDPPLFFLISGLFTRVTSYLSGKEFFDAIVYWRYFSILFPLISGYLWYQIIKKMLPENQPARFAFLLLLFSLPVLHKTLVMYTIEPWLLLVTSWTLWYFIFKVLPKPTWLNTIQLGLLMAICLLSRISALAILAALCAGYLGLAYFHRISWSKSLGLLLVFLLVVSLGTGWFYGRKSDIYEDRVTIIMNRFKGGVVPEERLAFLTEIPFHFMMTHPIRMEVWLNRFIPIYYSEFWGDFWNYFIQRRYGIDFEAREADRLLTTPQRVAGLALQNQVNLPTTILMVIGLGYLVLRILKKLRRPDEQWLIELIFLITFIVTWLGFLYSITFHGSAKGDSIKASYMLFILPIFVYQLVIFLFKVIKKHKYIFLPITLWLSLATIINLWWSWY